VPEFDGVVRYLRGRGDGSFDTPLEVTANFQAYDVSFGDFNGDDRVDFAITTLTDSEWDDTTGLREFIGDGTGAFRESAVLRERMNAGPPIQHMAADINGDGIDDLVARTDVSVMTLFHGTRAGLVESGSYHGSGAPYIVRRKRRLPAVYFNLFDDHAGIIESTCVPPLTRRRNVRR
jgi:hypothetical protein